MALGDWSLAYGDRDVCVNRVVDCSSLVMHGEISSVLGNIDGLVLTYVCGFSVFTFYPVLSVGECKFVRVAALTVVAATYRFSVCSWFFDHIHCRAFVIPLNVSIDYCV